MLYDFQRDAVLAIINKLEQYNGCILADSVGLGKTFTALAVIKYYENRNKSVLVLCPKKLAENWNTYKDNYVNNPIASDRLNYDVLFHTDLSRSGGFSNGLDLDRLNWGNYDLVVIDAYGIIGLNSKGSANKGFLKLSPILFSPQMRLMIDLRRKHAQNEDLSAKRSAACNSGSTVSDVVPSRLLQRQSAEHTPDVDLHRSTVRYPKDVSLACAA
jgi:SNF2 family DNA or RNA helicase